MKFNKEMEIRRFVKWTNTFHWITKMFFHSCSTIDLAFSRQNQAWEHLIELHPVLYTLFSIPCSLYPVLYTLFSINLGFAWKKWDLLCCKNERTSFVVQWKLFVSLGNVLISISLENFICGNIFVWFTIWLNN